MDGLTLLQEARAVGLKVMVEGDRLKIKGPRRAESFAKRLIAQKPVVLEALAKPQVPDLPGEWHLLWDERAAIREYDGGLSRKLAEAYALADVLQEMEQAGVRPKS
jgi:hypothetical protein